MLGELPVMIQHEKHIVEHSVHDGPFLEIQRVAHVEPVMEDEQPSWELAIDGEHTDAQAANGVAICSNSSSLQAYIDGAYNIIGLPLHVGEREAEFPSHISRVDQESGMRRHEFCRVEHSDVEVVAHTGTCAFDPALGVGW